MRRYRVLTVWAASKILHDDVFLPSKMIPFEDPCGGCQSMLTSKYCPGCDLELCAAHSVRGQCFRCKHETWVQVWLNGVEPERTIVGYEFAKTYAHGWRQDIVSGQNPRTRS